MSPVFWETSSFLSADDLFVFLASSVPSGFLALHRDLMSVGTTSWASAGLCSVNGVLSAPLRQRRAAVTYLPDLTGHPLATAAWSSAFSGLSVTSPPPAPASPAPSPSAGSAFAGLCGPGGGSEKWVFLCHLSVPRQLSSVSGCGASAALQVT